MGKTKVVLALLLALSRVCGIPKHNCSPIGLQVAKQSSGHEKVSSTGRACSQKAKAKVVMEPQLLLAESKVDGDASSQLHQRRWKPWWFHRKSANVRMHWKVNSRPKRKWSVNGRPNLKVWKESSKKGLFQKAKECWLGRQHCGGGGKTEGKANGWLCFMHERKTLMFHDACNTGWCFYESLCFGEGNHMSKHLITKEDVRKFLASGTRKEATERKEEKNTKANEKK